MYSLSYLYQALGANYYADRCELAAFNALPNAVAPDWWSRVYMTEPNSPWSKNLTETPFSDVNSVGQTYSLEGDYPCCTVNHPQGYPKFLSAAFTAIGTSGLAHALLSPTSVTTQLPSGAKVQIKCTTNYPFDLRLNYEITTSKPFDFYVRVPGWANVSDTTVSVNGGVDTGVKPDLQTGVHKISISSNGSTSLVYTLSTTPRIEQRPNSTVAIHHGALLYALYISSTNSSQPPHDYKTGKLLPEGYAPPQVRDWTITNTSAWNYAIDPSTLTYHSPGNKTAPGASLANPIWAPNAPPNYMTVKACQIDWPLYKQSVPGRVPSLQSRKCVGPVGEVRLIPFGSAKLHMVDLPTIDLSK
jgi:hypothetical protein